MVAMKNIFGTSCGLYNRQSYKVNLHKTSALIAEKLLSYTVVSCLEQIASNSDSDLVAV
jgi:hypothetical protein